MAVVAAFLIPVRRRSAAAVVFRTAARPAILTQAVAITMAAPPSIMAATVAAIITAAMAAPIMGAVTEEVDLLVGLLLAQLWEQPPPVRPITTSTLPASITGLFIKSRRRDQREHRLNRAAVALVMGKHR